MPARRRTATPIRQGVLIDVLRLGEHPEWITLSWETRGMALALMGMPLEDAYRGTLPPETDVWRNALGLPSAQTMAAVRERAIGLRGTRPSQELEHAWAGWLSELTRWFRPIDEAFLEQNPHWKDCRGRWWHPLLEDDTLEKQAGTRGRKSSTPLASEDNTPATKPARKVTTTSSARGGGRGKKVKVKDEALDYPPIRISAGVAKQQWDPPIDSNTRVQLWEAGIQAIGGTEKSARSLLGGLIKKYGEATVAEAVAKLAVRAVRPADPAAFLRKQVAIQAGETPGQRNAAAARAKVVL